jgi:hypothetical protein
MSSQPCAFERCCVIVMGKVLRCRANCDADGDEKRRAYLQIL